MSIDFRSSIASLSKHEFRHESIDVDNNANVLAILSSHDIPPLALLTGSAEEKNEEVRQYSVRGADYSSTDAGRCNSIGAVGIFQNNNIKREKG